MEMKQFGHYSFILGVVLAIVLGLFTFSGQTRNIVLLALVVLGLIVGFLNITKSEINEFLIASIMIVVGASVFNNIAGVVPYVGEYLKEIMLYLSMFIVPSALIVAFKAIYDLGKD